MRIANIRSLLAGLRTGIKKQGNKYLIRPDQDQVKTQMASKMGWFSTGFHE